MDLTEDIDSEQDSVDSVDGIDIPDGWASCDLAEHVYIAGRIGWRGLKAEEYTPSGPILLSVSNLNHGDIVDFGKVNHISQQRYDESPEIKLKTGDTLLVKDGAGIGKLGFVQSMPDRSTVNSSLLVVRPHDELLIHKYLFYYLKGPQFQRLALERITGSATPHLFQKDIKRLRILVPPRLEQQRIIEKLESCLVAVNGARDYLSRVPAILKRFREAVLAAACSGRLTEDWRISHKPAPSHERVHAIIEKRTMEQDGVITEHGDPDLSQVSDIPEGWAITNIGQLSCLVTSGSRGWAKYYSEVGPLFIRAQDINTDRLIIDDMAHVRPPNNAEGKRTRVCIGDLLVTITGANVTKAALVDTEIGESYVSQHVALVRLANPSVAPFLYLWIVSPSHGRAKLLEDAYGAGKPGLNLDNVRMTTVALPPLHEQIEIVRRVKTLFSVAETIEERTSNAGRASDRLAHSILATAFRGELVPTEAELARREGRDYEHASVLLERIKAHREVETAKNVEPKKAKRPAFAKRKGKS